MIEHKIRYVEAILRYLKYLIMLNNKEMHSYDE